MKNLINKIEGNSLDLRERLFRIILVVTAVISLFGVVETLVVSQVEEILLPGILLFVTLATSMVLTFKFNKIKIANYLYAVVIIAIMFPELFYISGGAESGASVWFTLSYVYVFMMFTGKELIFFTLLTTTSVIATFLFGYYYPEMIIPMTDKAMIYTDMSFSVIMVGITAGIFLQFYMSVYKKEQAVTLAQKKELEEINATRNTFFTSMSHEIRTPINSVIGLNEMILRRSNEEEIRGYAGDVKNASKLLLSLVNDILDLSKIEMQKMEIVPAEYDTRRFFSNIVEIIKIPASQKGLDFNFNIDEKLPMALLGDEKRITQILLNLLTNAVKYTEEGTVGFKVEGDFDENNNAILTIIVADTGIGIRKEDMEFLYDIFKRIDLKKNNKIEGSGLGLAITKQLVDLMGAELSVDSIYTKGTTFTLRLVQPIVDATPIGDMFNKKNIDENNYNRKFEAPEARILIVDDNKMNLKVATLLLSDTKVQIDTVTSGEACLAKTLEHYYHIILLDIQMPDMDGYSCMRAIKNQQNGLCRESAIIAMSASSADEVAKGDMVGGFDGILEKPITGDKLEMELLKFIPRDIIEYIDEDNIDEKLLKASYVDKDSRRKKVCVTTDCISDLPENLQQELGIPVMYMYIKTKTGRYTDTREIDSDYLSEALQNDMESISIDVVSVDEYEEFFAKALLVAEDVIHISLASKAGKSYGVAQKAAQSFDHVHIVDSGHLSCGQGLVVLYAAKLAKEGYDFNYIINSIDVVKKNIRTRFLMPNVLTLYKNGHVGKLLANMCFTFKLHPIVDVFQSKVRVHGVLKGDIQKTYKNFVRKQLRNAKKINTDVVFITFAACSARDREMVKQEVLKYIKFKRVFVQKASVSSTSNAGIGSIGIAYYMNDN